MAVAEYERDNIAERTTQGRRRSARNGNYPAARVPYGYIRTDGHLEEEPATAEVVRRMYALADKGAGIAAIATKLNEQCVAPASTQGVHGWQPSVVWKFLTNGVPCSCKRLFPTWIPSP